MHTMTRQRQTAYGMRVFTVIWSGQLVSTIGSGLTGFALGVWIYEKTGSTTLFAISLFVFFLPTIVFAPIAGVIADRWDRRVVMLVSDSMAGLSTLFIGVMFISGNLQVWHIYISEIFFSVANTLQWPAYSAATSLLVPKEHLGRAGGMAQVGDAISSLVSPALAGTLYVSTGLEAIIAIDLITYLFALGTLVAVRFPRPEMSEEGKKGRGSFLQETLYGWRYIWERKGLIGLQITLAGLNFCISVTHPLFVPMLLEMTTPDVLGYVSSILGLGILVGTLVMSAWGGPKRRIFGTYTFESLFGLSILLTGLVTSIPAITAARLLGMVALPIANGCTQAIWQSKVAQDVQGRVFSARRMISFSIIPVAYLLSGPLSERVFTPLLLEGGALAGSLGRIFGVGADRGIGLMFVFFGGLYVLIALGILLNPRVRRLELELPDVIPTEAEEDESSVDEVA